jgi:hypothetical protein
MIEIKNEEYYYKLPGYHPHQYQQHTPINMVYRTLQFMPKTFYERDMRKTVEEMWGVKRRKGVFGMVLRELAVLGYVNIVKEKLKYTTTSINRYTILPYYYTELEVKRDG